MNVMNVWKKGITGKGVRVGYSDLYMQVTHPDLVKAVDLQASVVGV